MSAPIPRKPVGTTKTAALHLRVTTAQLDAIRENARQANYTVTDYVVSRCAKTPSAKGRVRENAD